jgi:hypothetical protein
MWCSNASFGQNLELAAIDGEGVHPLIILCQRPLDGWVDATTMRLVDVAPTNWREWHTEVRRCPSPPSGARPLAPLGRVVDKTFTRESA